MLLDTSRSAYYEITQICDRDILSKSFPRCILYRLKWDCGSVDHFSLQMRARGIVKMYSTSSVAMTSCASDRCVFPQRWMRTSRNAPWNALQRPTSHVSTTSPGSSWCAPATRLHSPPPVPHTPPCAPLLQRAVQKEIPLLLSSLHACTDIFNYSPRAEWSIDSSSSVAVHEGG